MAIFPSGQRHREKFMASEVHKANQPAETAPPGASDRAGVARAGVEAPTSTLQRVALSRSQLLAVFDANAGRAEERYLELFHKLTRYFEWNRKSDPEDLAQEALRRGLNRLQQGQKITAENPESYFFGIARNLIREGWNSRPDEELTSQEQDAAHASFHNLHRTEQLVFLKECLRELTKKDLQMLLAYVDGDGDAWARKTGMPPATMRSRIHRIRKRLEKLAMFRRG
jgi:DNA-directed RNA polymerase specialized sigma24 family protein